MVPAGRCVAAVVRMERQQVRSCTAHWHDDLLLVFGGPVTAVPLVLFAYGAQRVSMTALGVMQYIAPTVALMLGVVVLHEPFGGAGRWPSRASGRRSRCSRATALRRYWRTRVDVVA